jgi:hypothetical protein
MRARSQDARRCFLLVILLGLLGACGSGGGAGPGRTEEAAPAIVITSPADGSRLSATVLLVAGETGISPRRGR